jgi:hypothetical protein
MKPIYFCISLFLLISSSGFAQSAGPKKEVLRVVQQLFDAMLTQDTLVASQVLMPDGQFYAVQHKGDSVQVGRRTHGQFIRSLVNKERVIDERMREKEVVVQIHQQLAMVWAPYDLWVNKTFSHCGVDIFTLIQTTKGWKIASLAYTIEPNGCKSTSQRK